MRIVRGQDLGQGRSRVSVWTGDGKLSAREGKGQVQGWARKVGQGLC